MRTRTGNRNEVGSCMGKGLGSGIAVRATRIGAWDMTEACCDVYTPVLWAIT